MSLLRPSPKIGLCKINSLRHSKKRFVTFCTRARKEQSSMQRRGITSLLGGLLLFVSTAVAFAESVPATADPLEKIKHVIVIYQENWSFDGLYGRFAGANGIAAAGPAIKQVDPKGRPYKSLFPPIDTN